MRTLGIVICIAAILAGCGGQQQSGDQNEAPSSAPGQQTSSAAGSSSTISRNGCSINLKKLCQGFIDQPNFVYQNVQYDWVSWSQNNPPHSELRIPVTLPNGESLGMVNCYIATQKRKATDGQLMRGPEISDKAIEYLKGKGWCEEGNPDYGKMWAEVMQKITPQ